MPKMLGRWRKFWVLNPLKYPYINFELFPNNKAYSVSRGEINSQTLLGILMFEIYMVISMKCVKCWRLNVKVLGKRIRCGKHGLKKPEWYQFQGPAKAIAWLLLDKCSLANLCYSLVLNKRPPRLIIFGIFSHPRTLFGPLVY